MDVEEAKRECEQEKIQPSSTRNESVNMTEHRTIVTVCMHLMRLNGTIC